MDYLAYSADLTGMLLMGYIALNLYLELRLIVSYLAFCLLLPCFFTDSEHQSNAAFVSFL